MAYTPTEWKSGDVITAEKLNNIESGIGCSFGIYPIIGTLSQDDNGNFLGTLNKTAKDIRQAIIEEKLLPIIFIKSYSKEIGDTWEILPILDTHVVDMSIITGGQVTGLNYFFTVIDYRCESYSYSAASLDDFPGFIYGDSLPF